jgi:hypothetical protein
MTKAITREDWLNQVAQRMRPLFAEAGAELPERFRITMSLTKRQRAIGVCFDRSASADGSYEILVRLDQHEPVQVAGILAHELVHAAVGVEQGHGPAFGKVARAIGLEGKLTATVPGERFVHAVAPILVEVGPFPHAPLDWAGQRSGPKKQVARLLKVECQECGLVVRQTRKWLDEVGPAHCPEHGAMQVADER